jgi:ubiquinone/menaquinone biosynthesis C-methylase UbiE
MSTNEQRYALGHSDAELERLSAQARFFGPWTEHLLHEAGVGLNMRVLDVGCGTGDVSLLLARIVGPQGKVVAVDRAAEAVNATRARMAKYGLDQVEVLSGDPTEMAFDTPFDAVVGRLVLMYFPQPAKALERLAACLQPGGVLLFQELDLSTYHALPPVPTLERCMRWISATHAGLGTHTQMGLKLYSSFVAAGLPAPTLRYDTEMGGGPDFIGYELVAQVVRSLLPMMERLGVSTREEVDIDTLERRLRDEIVSGGGVMVMPALIGAWCRLR